jgi:hypothetical protein
LLRRATFDLTGHEEALPVTIDTPEASAALARLFQAGATADERAGRAAKPCFLDAPPSAATMMADRLGPRE